MENSAALRTHPLALRLLLWRSWQRLAGLLAALALLTACTPPALLTAVLGQPVPGQAAQGKERRPDWKPYQEFTMEYNTKAPEKIDWPTKLSLLPKDEDGATDWVAALNANLIHLKSGLDDKAEAEDPLDLKVELTPKGSPQMKATYEHKIHTQLLVCDNCHPAIFKMEAGADPITMEKINAGEYCGHCHGKVAFDPADGCPRCHLGMAG